jgi:hypothetical protein
MPEFDEYVLKKALEIENYNGKAKLSVNEVNAKSSIPKYHPDVTVQPDDSEKVVLPEEIETEAENLKREIQTPEQLEIASHVISYEQYTWKEDEYLLSEPKKGGDTLDGNTRYFKQAQEGLVKHLQEKHLFEYQQNILSRKEKEKDSEYIARLLKQYNFILQTYWKECSALYALNDPFIPTHHEKEELWQAKSQFKQALSQLLFDHIEQELIDKYRPKLMDESDKLKRANLRHNAVKEYRALLQEVKKTSVHNDILQEKESDMENKLGSKFVSKLWLQNLKQPINSETQPKNPNEVQIFKKEWDKKNSDILEQKNVFANLLNEEKKLCLTKGRLEEIEAYKKRSIEIRITKGEDSAPLKISYKPSSPFALDPITAKLFIHKIENEFRTHAVRKGVDPTKFSSIFSHPENIIPKDKIKLMKLKLQYLNILNELVGRVNHFSHAEQQSVLDILKEAKKSTLLNAHLSQNWYERLWSWTPESRNQVDNLEKKAFTLKR